jgi:kynureninase
MLPGFEPIPTAEGWQLSNAPVLSMAPLWSSLQLFEEAGMERLHEKSKLLTSYLFSILNQIKKEGGALQILTPPDAHGCQVSIFMQERGKEVFNALIEEGVVADWREPGVIRVAPVPLYNTFTDVFHFGETVREILLSSRKG